MCFHSKIRHWLFSSRAARRRATLAAALLAIGFGLAAPLDPLRAALTQVPKHNLITINAGFEQAQHTEDNLWDGVDSDGHLCGFNFAAQVINENGSFNGLPMPPSVAFVDLDGDGLPDLITADPIGIFRFYKNQGTPTAPKFTEGEVIPVFVSSAFDPATMKEGNPLQQIVPLRYCPRFALADWRHSGVLDLLIGNYFGEILFVPNVGSRGQPMFRLPGEGIPSARIPTNDQGRYWGNLFAPAAADWTGHGKLDLLLGEGTYSANAIHLLENIGGEKPKFTSTKHTTIAYGEGREQLIPTVADYDGDGNPDLIVADRSGEVGVYLNPGHLKPETELTRTSTISFGGTSKLPGLVAPYAADFNGDGLFDLILGMPNGHIGVALNTGKKGAPSFGPIRELTGVDRLGRNIHTPEGWVLNTWTVDGNVMCYFSVVDAKEDPASAPPEGTHCLKAGYWPTSNKVFAFPSSGFPGGDKHFTLKFPGLKLAVGKPVQISFKAKGEKIEKVRYSLYSYFQGVGLQTKVEHGERGEVKASQHIEERVDLGQDGSVGSDWSKIEGSITPKYKSPALQDQKEIEMAFVVDFAAADLSANIYFDDFQVTQEGR